jgi:hypothetical protein
MIGRQENPVPSPALLFRITASPSEDHDEHCKIPPGLFTDAGEARTDSAGLRSEPFAAVLNEPLTGSTVDLLFSANVDRVICRIV